MDRVDRNVDVRLHPPSPLIRRVGKRERRAPNPFSFHAHPEHLACCRVFGPAIGKLAPSRRRPWSPIGNAVVALMPLLFTGCQTFTSPLSAWRAAYDGSLIKPISKEEMADAGGAVDSQNLFDRWITPRRSGSETNSADGSSPSTLILGSDGWRPIAKAPKIPRPKPRSKPPRSCSLRASSRSQKKNSRGSPRTARARPGARRHNTTWPNLNISAESMSMRTTTSRNCTRPIPLQITATSWSVFEYRHRPALEPSRRFQRPQGQTASLVPAI